jgi:hypothetical protein
MPPVGTTPKRRSVYSQRWTALDHVRAIACWLMIFSHAGVTFLPADFRVSSTLGLLLFEAGSYAPVVFFFATGVGYGLSSRKPRTSEWARDLSGKVCILIAADQFLRPDAFRSFGLDFFAFIAICTLVCSFLMTTRRPQLYAMVLAGNLVLLRYLFAPLISFDPVLPGIVHWIIGAQSVPGVSYPMTPWLVYPLIGLTLAPYIRRLADLIPTRRFIVFLTSSMILVAAITSALALHKVVFRWGTVSIAFFAISLAVLAVATAGAAFLADSRVASHPWLKISGPASLAVVPIHYALLSWLPHAIGPDHRAEGIYLLVLAGLIPVSINLAKNLITGFERLAIRQPATFRRMAWGGLLFAGTLALLMATVPDDSSLHHAEQLIALMGQLSACALFLKTGTQRSSSSPSIISR